MIPKDEKDVAAMVKLIKKAFNDLNVAIQKLEDGKKISKEEIKEYYDMLRLKLKKMKAMYDCEDYLSCFAIFKEYIAALILNFFFLL